MSLSNLPVTTTDLPFKLHRRGKVRDVYEVGDALLLVATDRISAFDVVLDPGVPGKGTILTRISNFWFQHFGDVENHLVETDFDRFPAELKRFEQLRDRSVLARKCDVIPIECVARGYLAGSGLKEYEANQTVCGIPLPPGLRAGSRLPAPIFTPATKAETGHDENITFGTMVDLVGEDLATSLRQRTLDIYSRASSYAQSRGIIIADTKFEFGLSGKSIIWIDEALTPDSSRFWPASEHVVGSNPPSYDKQFVRDWLESTGWNKTPPAPVLPPHVVENTRAKYQQAFDQLTSPST